jgi:hypothetical protein
MRGIANSIETAEAFLHVLRKAGALSNEIVPAFRGVHRNDFGLASVQLKREIGDTRGGT